MKLKLRQVWLMVHRWIGLTVGMLFAFSGLTGSLIVFNLAIDEWLNSAMLLTRNHGRQMSVAEILTSTAAKAPAPGKIVNVFYPRVANGVYTLHFREGEKSAKSDLAEVFVDPITAEILGQRRRNSGLMALIYQVHANLLSGESGRNLLGGLAMVSFVSLISGLILWWPMIRNGVRAGLAIRSRMFIFDLHKLLGAIFAAPLLLITATGVYLGLPDLVKPIVKSISEETKLPGKVKSTVPGQKSPPIGPDAAARVAQETMPGCRLMSIELPARTDDSYRVFVRQVNEVGQIRGVGRVWVDQYSGECLATRDWQKFTFADTYFRIQLALHSGDAFGLIGRCLFFLCGLIPSVLYVTGFILWRKRRNSQRSLKKRSVEQLTANPLVPSRAITVDAIAT